MFYDVLEPKIKEITMANQIDDKLQMELTSILVILMYDRFKFFYLCLTADNHPGNEQVTSIRICASPDLPLLCSQYERPGRMRDFDV